MIARALRYIGAYQELNNMEQVPDVLSHTVAMLYQYQYFHWKPICRLFSLQSRSCLVFKMTENNPQSKDIQFTVIEEERMPENVHI